LRTGALTRALTREDAEKPAPAIAITAMQSNATTKILRDFIGKNFLQANTAWVTKRGLLELQKKDMPAGPAVSGLFK